MPFRGVLDSTTSWLGYCLLDVFTDTPFQGNPLAVCLEAGALSPRDMQCVAREFNLSETVFVAATAMPGVFDLRIFTPHRELAFAGHPVLGAAWLLREIGWHDDQTPLVLRAGAGDTAIRFDDAHVWLSAPQPLSIETCALSGEQAAALLGLSAAEVTAEPVVASCGTPFYLIRLASQASLGRVRVSTGLLPEALQCDDHGVNLYLYVQDAANALSARRLRIRDQVIEDPATGRAAAPLAGYLALQSRETGTLDYTITQGVEMGRPGRIRVVVEKDEQVATAIHVGGRVVMIGDGRLRLPMLSPREAP